MSCGVRVDRRRLHPPCQPLEQAREQLVLLKRQILICCRCMAASSASG